MPTTPRTRAFRKFSYATAPKADSSFRSATWKKVAQTYHTPAKRVDNGAMSDKQKPAAAEVPHQTYSDLLAILPEEFLQPGTTEKLLNAQLAEALSIMRDASHFYHQRGEPHERSYFAEHTEKLLTASVKTAERIALLRNGGASVEKRFHHTFEHVEGGGGRQNPENE